MAETPVSGSCAAKVWHGWHSFPCERRAKRLVNGSAFCEQHARIEEKQIARRAAGEGDTGP